jgi:hypothetical protein
VILTPLPIAATIPLNLILGLNWGNLIDKSAIVCGFVMVLVYLTLRYKRNQGTFSQVALRDVLECALAGYAIPKGLFLCYAAYEPSVLNPITLYREQIGIGGIAVAYLAGITLKTIYTSLYIPVPKGPHVVRNPPHKKGKRK